MYKKRIAEKGNKEEVETPAAVQGAMVETWEYAEEDYVFAFGGAVIAAVQRPETHICIDRGASRSACPIGYAPEVTAKGKALPLYSIDGSPIEQRGHKRVHWEKRDSAGKMKRIISTIRLLGQVCCFQLRVSRVWKRMGHLLSFPVRVITI